MNIHGRIGNFELGSLHSLVEVERLSSSHTFVKAMKRFKVEKLFCSLPSFFIKLCLDMHNRFGGLTSRFSICTKQYVLSMQHFIHKLQVLFWDMITCDVEW
jgi:hypothetical protein